MRDSLYTECTTAWHDGTLHDGTMLASGEVWTGNLSVVEQALRCNAIIIETLSGDDIFIDNILIASFKQGW